MGEIVRYTIECTPAVGATGTGDATVTVISDNKITGTVRDVYLEYLDSPPAGTTDVTIVEAYNDPAQDILAIANAATDGWSAPMKQAVLNTSGAAITNQGSPVIVDDYISVTIAQANDADGVKVTLLVER
jgi:hypothetical protein